MPTNPAQIPAEWQHALAAHCRSQVRECDVWASFHVIAFIGVDVNVCGVCKRGESEPHPRTGLHFQLPPRWELLYPTRPDLVRLCRALGFGAPTEPTGPSNSNLLSLKHVISVYEAQLNLLLEAFDLATAMTRARDYMQMYEHQGARLGSVRERAGEWMFCGLLDAEGCSQGCILWWMLPPQLCWSDHKATGECWASGLHLLPSRSSLQGQTISLLKSAEHGDVWTKSYIARA